MRILFLNFEFPPIGGGGATAHRALLEALLRITATRRPGAHTGSASTLDLTGTLITSSERTHDYQEQLGPIRVVRLAIGKRDLHYWRPSEVTRYIARGWAAASRLTAREHFDLCHVFFAFPSGLIAWRFAPRLPYLLFVRGVDVPGPATRMTGLYGLLRPVLRRVYGRAAAVLANSDELRQRALAAFPSVPVGIVENGVDTERFHPVPDAGDLVTGPALVDRVVVTAEAASDPRRPGPIVLAVGRLIPTKGMDRLVRALAELRRTFPAARLVVAGDGPERSRLRALAGELGLTCADVPPSWQMAGGAAVASLAGDFGSDVPAVELLGNVPREQMPELYRRAAVLASASASEGMSNALLEAMASGLPIVFPDLGGAASLLDGNGLILSSREPGAIAAALEQVLGDPARAAAMGRVSRQRAESRSWDAAAQIVLRLSTDIVAGRPLTIPGAADRGS